IQPTKEFPEIRLRFTPAPGLVYGASDMRFNPDTNAPEHDTVFDGHEDRIIYDPERGKWRGHQSDTTSRTLTNPSDIYEGAEDFSKDKNKLGPSRGYLD